MLIPSKVSILTFTTRNGRDFTNGQPRRQAQPASRAIRLVDDPTRFLLVNFSKNIQSSDLRYCLSNLIRSGVDISGKHYAWLGYSESQLKAGKVMFFLEGPDWTVPKLLERFGELEEVYLKSGYGKYAARLGLSFSSTVPSLDVPPERALQIPDMKAPDGSLHTDGCGMIRDSFARLVCRQHDLPQDTTVFQIRRGGIKGLLVRYPDDKFDEHCRQGAGAPATGRPAATYDIAYRPSMYKYEGGPTNLELNDHNDAHPSYARLNEYFILVLSTLGVPYEIFERLLLAQLEGLANITTDYDCALKAVKGELDSSSQAFYQDLYEMLLARHDFEEPAFQKSLAQFQRFQYDKLREKLALRVDASCYLYGVVDEDGILGPEEVFVNLPDRSGALVRPVVVARNPSYHPGDFRVLQAVDKPALCHHKNCIVFSRTAPRSVPDTMAGGDLDGDTYFVCWDSELIPPRRVDPLTRAPSAVAAGPARRHRMSDMPEAAVATFIQFRFNWLMGTMANKWKEAAQLTPSLARGEFALALVPGIEAALDATKTGDDFKKLENDFKAISKRFESHGRQPAACGPLQKLKDLIPSIAKRDPEEWKCDPALIIRHENPELWDVFYLEAHGVMGRFNRDLTVGIGIDKATEKDTTASQLQKDTSQKEADAVRQRYREQYFSVAGVPDCDKRKEHERQRLRASAWYKYAYSQKKEAFAWLGLRYLNEIRAAWTNNHEPVISVGASSGRACNTTMRLGPADSLETLVGSQPAGWVETRPSSPMEVEPARSGRRVDNGSASTAGASRDPIQAIKEVARRQSAARTAPHPVVSVASHPKPSAPVVSGRIADCVATPYHRWSTAGSNGSVRRYTCPQCGLCLKERKNAGFWEPAGLTMTATSLALRLAQDERTSASTAVHEDVMEVDEPEPEAGSTRPRTSLASDAPSSLAGFSPTTRRLPTRAFARNTRSCSSPSTASSEVFATPASSPRALTPSGSAFPERLRVPSARQPLVSDHPKPQLPAAVHNTAPCTAPKHAWKLRWAGGVFRHYDCRVCGVLVKEQKCGQPQVWVPYLGRAR